MSNSKFEYVKNFESHEELLKNTYIVVYVDGTEFKRLAEEHHFTKPNDIRGIKVMMLAALSVIKSFNEIFFAYGHSDKFSFAFRKDAKVYNRRKDKIVTNVISQFTSAYVYNWGKVFKEELNAPIVFDGNIVLYPSIDNLKDYFSWKMDDCHINNLYDTTYWALVKKGQMEEDTRKQLIGKLQKDKNEILHEMGINYNSEPLIFKRGLVLFRIAKKALLKDIKYSIDKLIYEDDDLITQTLKENDSVVVCHENILKADFWNKDIINFD